MRELPLNTLSQNVKAVDRSKIRAAVRRKAACESRLLHQLQTTGGMCS